MSTLRESLKHRHAEATPPEGKCHSASSSAPALSITTMSGERWVFPWSHFVSARHSVDGNREKVTIAFANHEVELLGVSLAKLIPEIAGLCLDSLRDLPAKYEPQNSVSEPFIERLSVRPIGSPSRGIASSS